MNPDCKNIADSGQDNFYDVFAENEKIDTELEKNFTLAMQQEQKKPEIKLTDKGQPAKTIENFLSILRNDNRFSNVRYNLLTGQAELHHGTKIEAWNDTDDSQARNYIEATYKLFDANKLDDALKIYFSEQAYHPVKELLEATEWDGIPRLKTMLSKWLKCDDTPYTQEVSRLIFAGGINRLYNPGCKFDEVPILIGTKQGEGKSTFVRWLALNDSFFKEVREIEGQKGVEALQGGWICELSELLALTKAKEVEAVKSYLTCTTDSYRQPYCRHVSHLKRQCIFIGTTNRAQFLTDRTGNRRFYPIIVHSTAMDLFSHEDEIKTEILQCWAEAKSKLGTTETRPYADISLKAEITAAQSTATEEDYRVGLIMDYIAGMDETCILEVWREALDNKFIPPSRKDSNEISMIMQSLGWKTAGKAKRFLKFGVQKLWAKGN